MRGMAQAHVLLPEKDEHAWAQRVFGPVQLGHRARRRSVIDYAARQARAAELSTYALAQGKRALEVRGYRVFRNEEVTQQGLLDGLSISTLELAASSEEVLMLEDTTKVQRQRLQKRSVKGSVVKERKVVRESLVHSVVAVDAASGAVLGLAYQQWWQRPPSSEKAQGKEAQGKEAQGKEAQGKEEEAQDKPYEQRESYKWERASRALAHYEPLQGKCISVCDREADVYEYIDYKLEHGERFVVRAAQNRKVQGAQAKLWPSLQAQPEAARIEVKVEARGGRPARTAHCCVRYAPIEFVGKSSRHPQRQPQQLFAVLVEEIDPPQGQSPLEWLLLTTEALRGAEDALRIVRYYKLRGLIEEFHKAWKSGCRVEHRQLKDEGFDKLAVVLAAIAIRILQLRDAADARPEASCEEVFAQEEWKCLHAVSKRSGRLPKAAPSLRWAMEQIAHLGGWRDTHHNGAIGWITLYRGWKKFLVLFEGWQLARGSSQKKPATYYG